MRSIMLAALLVIGITLSAGIDDSGLPGPGETLMMVGGSEPDSQYQQYYNVGGSEPAGGETISYMVSGSEPESLVVNGQAETFDPNSVPMNSYWIQGTSSWTQYIRCPMYARFKLLAYTQGGIATVREDYPNGTQVKKDFQYYPGYTRQTFTADAEGRHVIGFEINGQLSNAVIVDVEPQGSIVGPQSQPGAIQSPGAINGQSTSSSGFQSSQKSDPGI